MVQTTAAQIILGFGVFFILLDVLFGALRKRAAFSLHEIGVNILSFINFIFVRAVLVAFYGWLLVVLFPHHSGFLSGVNFWLAFITYVLVEEYIHYWMHRLSHSVPWLWRLHKPHHLPEHVNVTIAFRENWLWFVVLPYSLMGAFMVWAGQAEAAIVAAAWKGSSEFMVHTNTRWDLKLHALPLTRPIMRVLEKFITLPDTHHAHHGLGKYGHGMCNFGSFLFIFDIIHGTAKIPHHEQERFGVPDRVKVESWYEQLWWPMAKDVAKADLNPPTQIESQGDVLVSANGKVTVIL
ncbi:Fatty acid hydroxylase superfamily protein [Pseudovibrio axinellae]|uniref:Fatty acid hydroxylase superfamily protein n=1 Tax=Pseudovibrio axinellae TaxID=989403 RepID=A0A165ZST5_9HYPH|nr:sterol desaturase family protein [Pseudovibrio axinellae]KZL20236.1 Fatty acid hydroxylase superfamily protein [Pseudovibrio axinellae]SEQ62141.1 Sterol desaturase/sphingolipid hydroxylase, fatty acid hydroxylase superfamily [Pseudovibrio axinellae]